MKNEIDYSKLYNKGNNCDECDNSYLCGLDGDVNGCQRKDQGLECEFIEFSETSNNLFKAKEYIENMNMEYKNMSRAYAKIISYNEKLATDNLGLTEEEKEQYKNIRSKLIKKINRDCVFVNAKLQ